MIRPTADGKPPSAGLALSVIIPAYQEAHRIGATVTQLRRALQVGPDRVEIIVVDDGSRDATAACAEQAGADRVVRLSPNQGKGAAVRAGVTVASGDVVVFTDADLAYAPAQIMRLAAVVRAGGDVVVGSRRHPEATRTVRSSRLREVSGRVFNLVTRRVLNVRFRDTQCGLKAFSGSAAKELFRHSRIDGFAFDVELLVLAERRGMKVREVPVDLAVGEGSTVHVGLDAFRMVRDVARIRRWARSGVYAAQDSNSSQGASARLQ